MAPPTMKGRITLPRRYSRAKNPIAAMPQYFSWSRTGKAIFTYPQTARLFWTTGPQRARGRGPLSEKDVWTARPVQAVRGTNRPQTAGYVVARTISLERVGMPAPPADRFLDSPPLPLAGFGPRQIRPRLLPGPALARGAFGPDDLPLADRPGGPHPRAGAFPRPPGQSGPDFPCVRRADGPLPTRLRALATARRTFHWKVR